MKNNTFNDNDNNNNHIELALTSISSSTTSETLTPTTTPNFNNDIALSPQMFVNVPPSRKLTYKRVGNCILFFFGSYKRPIITIGPHYYLYFLFTIVSYIAVICPFYYFGNFLLQQYITLSIFSFVIFRVSYVCTVLINPGIPDEVNENEIMPDIMHTYCNKCLKWYNKCKGTFHCNLCDICIEEYDHHCPYIGKCVGKGNIAYFKVFCMFFIMFVIVETLGIKQALKSVNT